MRAFYAPVNELNRCGAARGGALINEREQVCVGELLLDVGERDRFAVERVERLAREVVPEFGELRLSPRRPESLPIVSDDPRSPTDCGVMIS